jgi:16S rRNA processing protein RimM
MTQYRVSPEGTNTAGSLQPGEPAFIAVGKLRRPHGLHGEILMEVLTEFPERLVPGMAYFVGPEHLPLKLVKLRNHKDGLIITFEGYDTPENVGELRNQMVFVITADRPPLPEGEYYHHQLIGLRVVSESGETLGMISSILETGANDVLIIQPSDGQEILIPLIDPVIQDIDLELGEVHVQLLPGLIDR